MKNIFKLNKKSKKTSKVVVGSAKKKLTRNKWKVAYLSLVGLLLFSSIGYTGLGYVKTKQLKARAESWSYLGSNPAVKSYACKEPHNTIYGKLWKIKILNWKIASPSVAVSVTVKIISKSGTISTTSNQWLYGVVQGIDLWMPAYGDYYYSSINPSSSPGGNIINGYIFTSYLSNC